MANRSYLYAINFDGENAKPSAEKRIYGLSEANYTLPLFYKILVSQELKQINSLVLAIDDEDDEEIEEQWMPKAIQGNFNKGREKLYRYFDQIIELDLFNKDELLAHFEKVKHYLDREDCDYILLECAELCSMYEDAEENYQSIVNELKNIDQTIQSFFDYLKSKKQTIEELNQRDARYRQFPLSILAKICPCGFGSSDELKDEIRQNAAYELIGGRWSDILYFDFENNQYS